MAKILVIEDEEFLRDEVMEWLTLENFEALGAADGVEGIGLAFEHLPDLILCDITMPRLDGHGVLMELQTNTATVAIPFIFMTARASHDDIRKGMQLGADDYITKPFTRLELFGAIHARLGKKSLAEQRHQSEVRELQHALAEEHELRMLKAKLVAGFSHDFRNPLASIRSSNSLVRDYGHRMDDEQKRKHFKRIDAATRQLVQMLDEMLLVAQIETGNLEYRPERINPDQFIWSIVDEFQSMSGESHSITYNSQYHADTDADPRLLRQITANLISNAVKYSPEGSDVLVSLGRLDKDFILSVQDYGIGIPEADQSRLFESFQRASNVGGISGTGLGLSIVRQAVDLHGGAVQLESQLGEGTMVKVTIPIVN